MESIGIKSNTGEIPASAKSMERAKRPVSDSTPPVRRSVRLKDACKSEGMEATDDHVSGISDYERLRISRIRENKARMASLGIDRSIKELRDIFSFRESKGATKRMYYVKPDLSAPCRRSGRLQGRPCEFGGLTSPDQHRSDGSVRTYCPIFWFCCHVCRQKKLCGEEECGCCVDQDINQPCIGKTQCSFCYSPKGILCRACLKVRYGEEIEEIRKNKDWMCPHCVEEKGINPYWICNSSLCLEERKMPLTGIAIDQARELGYESVAHLIMDKLKRGGGF